MFPGVIANGLRRSFPWRVARLPEARQSSEAPAPPIGFYWPHASQELTACMGHAADLGDAQLKAGLVAGKVITHQLPVPGAQEVTRMFTGTAGAEVVDNSLECRKWRAAVGPDVSTVGFLLAGSQHLYRRFVGVDYALGQHCFAQRIDQRLKLHAGLVPVLRE